LVGGTPRTVSTKCWTGMFLQHFLHVFICLSKNVRIGKLNEKYKSTTKCIV